MPGSTRSRLRWRPRPPCGFCHTLPSSAKPVALFADVPGTPTYTPRDLLRLSAFLAPLTAALVLVFALAVWPLLGVPVLLETQP